MKTTLICAALVMLFGACEDDTMNSARKLEKDMAGDWLLVSQQLKLDNNALMENETDGIFVEIGGRIGWLGSIGVNENRSLSTNNFWNEDLPALGTWKLDNRTFTMFTALNVYGIIQRDTLQFNASIDGAKRLVLENDTYIHKYRRIE